MNGRVYVPALARFLSPDPYVQAPLFSQNFNRYSYALNNPLMYSDPSGEKWWGWALGVLHMLDPIGSVTAATVTLGSAATSAGITASMAMPTSMTFAGTTASIDQGVTFAGAFIKGADWGKRRLKNSFRMLGGMFQEDENKGFWADAGIIASRWTWESIQSWGGYGYSPARRSVHKMLSESLPLGVRKKHASIFALHSKDITNFANAKKRILFITDDTTVK
jgi:hypothetical protein